MWLQLIPLILFLCHLSTATVSIVNNRPIIGILAQEILPQYTKYFGLEGETVSYIASSYVKFVESAGARVVPVMVNQDMEYYRFIAESVNGILFPGGATYFNGTDGYFGAGRVLYDLAVEMNGAGEYFPLLGICLGFELLAVLAADNVDHRTSCRSYNRALALHFNHGFQESKMFSGRSLYHKEIVGILSLEHVTPDFHHYCITEANMTDVGTAKDWQIISFNKDSNGLEFVSTMEHMKYPFYGLQYHPEKNAFEWKIGKNHPHFPDAILTSQFFANFFVNEARKNNHRFPTTELERQHLIYNYDPKFTLDKTVFQQCYLF